MPVREQTGPDCTEEERAVLAQRAAQYAQTGDDTGGKAGGRNILVCRVGAAPCALDCTAVEQILPWGQLLILPSLPDPFVGLMVVRGALTPVAEPGGLLGLRTGDGPDRRIVIVRTGDHRIGLVVDAVHGIRWERERVRTELSELRPAIRALIAGITADRTILLDSDALVAELHRRAQGIPSARRERSTAS